MGFQELDRQQYSTVREGFRQSKLKVKGDMRSSEAPGLGSLKQEKVLDSDKQDNRRSQLGQELGNLHGNIHGIEIVS